MGVKILVDKFGGGGQKFWTSSNFRFLAIIIFLVFWTDGKNLPNRPEKKYGNIGLRYRLIFLLFSCHIHTVLLEI